MGPSATGSLTATHTLAGLRRMPNSKEVAKTATRA